MHMTLVTTTLQRSSSKKYASTKHIEAPRLWSLAGCKLADSPSFKELLFAAADSQYRWKTKKPIFTDVR